MARAQGIKKDPKKAFRENQESLSDEARPEFVSTKPKSNGIDGDDPDAVLRRKSGLYQVGEGTAQGEAYGNESSTETKRERAVEQFGAAMDEAFDDPSEKSWYDSTLDSVGNAASGVWNGVTKAWDSVGDKFTSLWENAKKSVTGATDYVGDQISSAVDTVSTTTTNAWDSTTNFVSSKFTSAKNWLFGSSEPQAANINTPPATPVAAAPTPEAAPLIGSHNDIELTSGESITAQFRQAATTAPKADNSNNPQATSAARPRTDFTAAPGA